MLRNMTMRIRGAFSPKNAKQYCDEFTALYATKKPTLEVVTNTGDTRIIHHDWVMLCVGEYSSTFSIGRYLDVYDRLYAILSSIERFGVRIISVKEL